MIGYVNGSINRFFNGYTHRVFATSPREGMALVIVLALSMALLTLGGSYLHTIQNQTPVNPTILAFAQADILAQGIAQIATLKFKELPGPFYYSFIASTKGNAKFLNKFKQDPILAGAVTDPIEAEFATEYTMYSSQMYDDMNLKIAVAINIKIPGGKTYSRLVEHTLNGIRHQNN